MPSRNTVLALGAALVIATPGLAASAPDITQTPVERGSGPVIDGAGLDLTDDADGWRRFDLIPTLEDGTTKTIAAVASPADAPGVMLLCQGGRFDSYFSLEGYDFQQTRDWVPGRQRSQKGNLYIEGERADRSDWIFLPDLQVAKPISENVSRKLYNAIVKGQEVSFQVSVKDETELALPPVDDNYRDFAQTCAQRSE